LSALSAENLIGLIAGIILTIYLFVALVLPERF
jgi:K+-transporting ATPase KdpF subunit